MPSGIYIHKQSTEETRKKLSDIAKNHGFGKWMTGKKLKEETKLKISLANKGRKWSKIQKDRFKPWHKGKSLSDEHKKKLSLAKIGKPSNSKGKKRSEESRKRISLGHKGEKNCRWQGGKSFEDYGIEWTDILRQSIRERDGYACKKCGINQSELLGMHKKLSVHHIDYDKKNLDPKNLITLCVSCHMKTNFNREKWLEYFKSL
jgi:hypothetical protein